ncbi:MAG: membrane protein insertase YidC [Alphaproteobacteria bacterium]|nr:membrane protein insertase YidC [Alphaproteobacteria bacterium]
MLKEEKENQRNMVIMLVLILAIFMVPRFFMEKKTETVNVPLTTTEEVVAVSEPVQAEAEKTEAIIQPAVGVQLPIENSFVSGALTSDGTRISALNLTQYRETTEADSPAVSLLTKDFYTSLNWEGASLPDTTRAPQVSGTVLSPETPIVLTWENEAAKIERTISLDNAYLMTFTDKVINKSTAPLKASLVGRVVRNTETVPDSRSTVHEGFLGLFDSKEKESRYMEITAEKSFVIENKGGWIGQTDKYWQAIFVPDQSAVSQMRFERDGEFYQSSFKTDADIAAGASLTRTTKLFAGAKELKLINSYEEEGIPRFDLSIDFGWYYFLTKPFLYFLGWLYNLIGNMGIVILVFATLIRLAMLPIATKSYESMAKMKKVQPKMEALKERFKDNKQQLQIEMMNLYKREKVTPASGCLPMLIQIPVFFALYKVLSVSILMRQAPFFGWITDLSQPDPSSVFTAFGYLPWPIPSFLNIGVWPLIMGLTMVIQQRLSPSAATNKDQKLMMNMMPIIFTFMLGNFASGLVIYWTWSNILSIAQQKYIMKKVGA